MNRLIAFINTFTLNNQATRINPFDKTNEFEMKVYADAQALIDYIKGQEEAAEKEEPAREYTQKEADDLKSQFANQQFSTLDEYRAQVIQHSSQLKMYQDSLSEYMVVAEQDGIVHLNAGLTVGTMIQAGSLIGNINSDDNLTLFIDTVISATDRAKIKESDTVEIALSGVMQSEFGVFTDEIISIANDRAQTEDGAVFYCVKIKTKETQLKDRKGNTINLTLGMLADSRIKYDETTWLKWAIEQIGVKFK